MNIRIHIERLVLEPGSSIDASQFESALRDALGAASAYHVPMVMPECGLAIDHLRGDWSGGSLPANALGSQLGGILIESVFSGHRRERA